MSRMQSIGFTVVALLALIVAAFVVTFQQANAQQTDPIVLDPASGPPATTVIATGIDWDPGDFIQARWDEPDEVLGDVIVDEEGQFELTLTIPDDATLGEHEIHFYYGNSTPCELLCEGEFEPVPFLVTEQGSATPSTSVTGTVTETATVDPSVTPSGTATGSATVTETATGAVTETATGAVTETAPATATVTLTATATNAATNTPAPTNTSTPAAAARTPTRVPTRAPTARATATRRPGTPAALPQTGSGGYLDQQDSGSSWTYVIIAVGALGIAGATGATLHYVRSDARRRQ